MLSRLTTPTAKSEATQRPSGTPVHAVRRGPGIACGPLVDLFDRFQDFVVLVDREARLLAANRSWCQALGFEASAVRGLPLSAVVPTHELAWWHHWLDPDHPVGEVGAVHVRWQGNNGRDLAVEGSVRVCGEDEAPARLLGVFHDWSRLAAADAARRDTAALYHVVETRAPIGVFQTDAVGRLLRSNARWRRIANLDHAGEPRGVWWQMVDPADRPRVLAAWKTTQQYGREFREEFRVQTSSELPRYTRTTIVRNAATDGSLVFFLGVSEDITDQRRAEAELQEAHRQLERRVRLRTAQLEAANRELAQFAHVVAHDLKAPMRAVSNLSEWLERDCYDQVGAEGRRFLSLLRQRARHMHDLIEGILAYTRFGPLIEADVEVDLEELVGQVITVLAPPSSITFRFPTALPRVQGVTERLRHIFQNLLDNAVKFLDKPQGVVTVTAARLADAWEFAVADNGPGISPHHHERVFKMFEQLPEGRSNTGTGIGLAIVKRIVESRGGRIRLESTEGGGAVFTFTWPDKPLPPDIGRDSADPAI